MTHSRLLRGLEALSGLEAYDVGSIHGTAALPGRMAALTVFRNILGLRRKLSREHYDMLLLHHAIMPAALVKLALILLVVPRSLQNRTLVFFHGGRFERIPFLRFWLVRRLLEFPFGRARRFYFLSDPERLGFMRYFPDLPYAMFRNYAESDEPIRHRVPHRGSLRLLFVGRVAAVKGIFVVLDALDRLNEALVDFELTVVGSGPDLERVREWCTSSVYSDRVRFAGYLAGDALLDAYRSADVLVFPTMHPEGFPYVLIEAMRAGLPVVSTSEGVLPHYVKDDETGYLVPPNDSEALARAILRLSDPSVLFRLSTGAYACFREYFAKSRAESFYRGLVAEIAGPSSSPNASSDS